MGRDAGAASLGAETDSAARRSLWILALATTALHLSFAGRYGFFRDELYFIACGARPAWGYVDQPPLLPLLAYAWDALGGGSLFWFRVLPALGAGALALSTGRLALQLGAGTYATLLAASAVCLGPVFLVATHLFTVNLLEPVLWTWLACCVLRLQAAPTRRCWIEIGVCVATGLLNKYSMAFWSVSLVAGLACTPHRRVLLSRGAAAAVLGVILVCLPNAVWQAQRGFPMLELLRAARHGKNVPFELLGFFKDLVTQANPITLPLWGFGLLELLRKQRSIGIAALLLLGTLCALQAKAYYAAPVFPTLIAAGCVAVERLLSRASARAIVAGVVLACEGAIAPLAVPILSVERLIAYQRALGFSPPRLENREYGELPQHLADQFGWPEIGAAVASAWRRLPEADRRRGALFAFNYGDTAASARFGGVPSISGHNQYAEFGPAPSDGSVLLVLGGTREELERNWEQVDRVGTGPSSPYMMPYERARPIWVVRRARLPLVELWSRLRHID